MCLPVRDPNVTVTPGRPAGCLGPRSWICALLARTPLPRLRDGREAETEGRQMIFEGVRLEARKWLAGFFSLAEPRIADVGGMRRRQRRLLTRMGVLDGTGSEKQAPRARARAKAC